MTATLKVVPPAEPDMPDALRDAVIAWADGSALLASGFADALRSGQEIVDLAGAFIAQVRRNTALLETIEVLLDQA
jgi:hypothetical protein